MTKGFQKGHVVSEETRRKIGAANSAEFYCSCDYCEEMFKTKPSAHAKKKRHFCCTACYALFRAELLPKEEHPRFGKGFPLAEKNKRAEARSVLNHAIRDGKIITLPCEFCGGTENIEAHHSNYGEPLNVQWLCRKHHRQLHKQIYENPEMVQP